MSELPVTEDQEARLIEAKTQLYYKEAWLASFVAHLRYQVVESNIITTACTDGKTIFFNRAFLASLTIKQIVFLLGHEMLHVILNHLPRKQKRDRHVWNIACDYVVNGFLVDFKIGEFIESGLYKEEFSSLSADEVYQEIISSYKQTFQLDTLDQHADIDNDTSSSDSHTVEIAAEMNRLSATQDPAERAQVNVQEALDKFLNDDTKSIRLKNALRKFWTPDVSATVNWREVFHQYIREFIQMDLTYLRPQKKSFTTGITLPSYTQEADLTVAIALDTSSSMRRNYIRQFLAEIKKILETYPAIKIHLWSFAEQVWNTRLIEFATAGDLESYALVLNGQTFFTKNWEYMKKENLQPDIFVMLTDGKPSDNEWGDCPTIQNCVFVIIDQPEIKAPFGQSINIDSTEI